MSKKETEKKAKPLTNMQINAVLDRLKKNFRQRAEAAQSAADKKIAAERVEKLEKLLASVQPEKTRRRIIGFLERANIDGIPNHDKAYEAFYKAFTAYDHIIEELRFDLIMSDAVGYKEIVAEAEAKGSKLLDSQI